MNGQDDDRAPTRALTEEECWSRVEAAPVRPDRGRGGR